VPASGKQEDGARDLDGHGRFIVPAIAAVVNPRAGSLRTMIRRLLRVGIRLGVLAVVGYGVARFLQRRQHELTPAPAAPTWPPVTPSRAEPSAAPAVEATGDGDQPVVEPSLAAAGEPVPPQAWVEPSGDACPASHPIKGKLSSRIFHLPGMMAYDRCKPDRCYASEDAAEADGLRRAKR
jgi:hypothetical protein